MPLPRTLAEVVTAVRWGALTGATLLLALRWSGLTGGWIANSVLSLVPLLALGALVLAVEAGVRRDRLGATAALAVLALTIVTIAPRALPSAQPLATGEQLTVAVANLKLGLADPETVVRLVRDEDIDVLVTIELYDSSIDALRDAGLEDELPFSVLEPTSSRAGGGVYSRHPLRATSAPTTDGGEPDVLVALPGGGSVHLTSAHPRPPINRRYAQQWQQSIADLPAPEATPAADAALLLGDLNATLDHRPFRDLLARGWRDAADEAGTGLHPTFWAVPTGGLAPPMAIDHVLVDDAVAVDAVRTHHLPRSDHRMLVADLTLP